MTLKASHPIVGSLDLLIVKRCSCYLYWLQFNSAAVAAGLEDKQIFNFGHGRDEILSKLPL